MDDLQNAQAQYDAISHQVWLCENYDGSEGIEELQNERDEWQAELAYLLQAED